ncbi:ExeM/NucH family extracellular endonuclease [Uliginosibacterium paludis]|uniref:ExeM/NucH family extracellular endonuclease n=1 Tax=Uliginosibacterium paludis TaxID=1615952 RepID=UPI0031F64624
MTVRGIVTGAFQGNAEDSSNTQLNGFFIQQPVADADPLTSEGLFIYAQNATVKVAVGDYVQVAGKVAEYKGTGDTRTLTELSEVSAISVCGSGLSVTPTTLTLPLASAEALEAYEGMLVRFEQTLTVTDVSDFGHYGSIGLSNGRLWEPYNHPSMTPAAVVAANALNRIILDDGSTKSYPNMSVTPIKSYLSSASGTRRVGDTLTGVSGPLTWSANAWRFHPVGTVSFVDANPRTAAPASVGGSLKVAHYNVENFFTTLGSRGASTATDFARQRKKLVAAIAAIDADVINLIETQNDAGVTLANLVTALNEKVGAGTYSYVDVGIAGTDEIIQAMLYKPAKVKTVGNPQIITDTNFAVSGGMRPSIAQRFASVANGGGFWMVANHLKSKGSCPSSSSSADAEYGQGCWNASRTTQAKALRDWVAGLVSASGESDVLMMGDFNAYIDEDPLKVLESAGYEALLRRLPANQRNSYQFDGETGALDHAFASSLLKSQVSGITVWHINSEEPEIIDYTTANKNPDLYTETPYRGSDHDPVVVGLNLNADAAVSVATLSANVPTAATVGTSVSITNLLVSNGTALTVSWGDGNSESLALAAGSASHTYASPGTYTITLTLTGSGLPATRSSTIKVTASSSGGSVSGPELFFSEYIEGTSNNKALEIYNPLSTSVDLSAYTVKIYANGSATSTGSLALSGTLGAGETLVIRHSSFTTAFTGFPATAISNSTVVNFNGDDAVTLEKNGSTIDGIGVVGTDPGTEWVSGTVSTLNKTLRRKSGITQGSIPGTSWDVATEWDVYDVDTFSGLGSR